MDILRHSICAIIILYLDQLGENWNFSIAHLMISNVTIVCRATVVGKPFCKLVKEYTEWISTVFMHEYEHISSWKGCVGLSHYRHYHFLKFIQREIFLCSLALIIKHGSLLAGWLCQMQDMFNWMFVSSTEMTVDLADAIAATLAALEQRLSLFICTSTWYSCLKT